MKTTESFLIIILLGSSNGIRFGAASIQSEYASGKQEEEESDTTGITAAATNEEQLVGLDEQQEGAAIDITNENLLSLSRDLKTSPSSLRSRSTLPLGGDSEEEHESHDSAALEFWLWGESTPSPVPVANNSTCASQKDCESCLAKSYWCHWCKSTNACHSKGSFYGCLSGVSQCKEEPPVDPDDDHGCASHRTCQECATASHFCHWCGHDQACHAIGSVYGCTVGVDCFSNDRCKRSDPEALPRQPFWTQIWDQEINALPVAIITAVAVFICCCASLCFCLCSGVKGAYDDLADFGVDSSENDTMTENENNHQSNDLNEPLLQNNSDMPGDDCEDENQGGAENALTHGESVSTAVEEGEAVGELQSVNNISNTNEGQEDNYEGSTAEVDEEHSNSPLPDESDPLLTTEGAAVASVGNSRRSIRGRRPRHMQRLYNGCRACYIVTLCLMCTIVFVSIRFFPQIPVYNICNDDVAWKSIIDSMKKMHTRADFEILASLSNPNHIDVALDKGTGYFHHKGKFAGTFTIPPFTAKATSITDMLIIASLTPETWDAFQIAKEYEMGNLILHVNTTVIIRIPALADFTYEGSMGDIEVHVNEVNDRHLCACPSWDEAKNHSFLLLEDEEAEAGSNDSLSLTLPVLQDA